MRRLKISNAVNKTGDTGDDYVINLYDNYDAKPVALSGDTVYKIKIGNDIGYLKTLQGTIGEDNSSLILSAKDLAEFPDGTYYIEVWFEKDGLNYIFPSSGKARIKLDANIETIKGKMIPTLTVEELRQEIAEKAVAGKDGKSAYQIWLDAGNTGSEQDFLNSLNGIKGDAGEQGPQGLPGKDGADGVQGLAGKDGLSAYQIWLGQGNTGSEADFLRSLKGKDGKTSDIDLEALQFYIPSGDISFYVSGENGLDENNESIEAQTVRVQKQGDKYILLTSDGANLLQVLYHKIIEHESNLGVVMDTLTSLLSNDYVMNPLLNKMQTMNYNSMLQNQAELQQYSEATNKQIKDLQGQIDELKKSE